MNRICSKQNRKISSGKVLNVQLLIVLILSFNKFAFEHVF